MIKDTHLEYALHAWSVMIVCTQVLFNFLLAYFGPWVVAIIDCMYTCLANVSVLNIAS